MVIDSDRVSALFAHECSVVVDKVTTRSPGMAELCSAVGTFFRVGAGANAYLTPGGEHQGFSAHYDTHDAVVIQIEGTKKWRVYDWGTELALQSQTFNPKKHTVGDPKLEIEMRPGDVLYIPRGVIHEARSSDALSLHVTIGLYPIKWFDVLREAVDAAGDEVALRRSISIDAPPNFDDPELVAALGRVLSTEKLKAAEQKLVRAFLTERSNDLEGQLRQIAQLRALDERSWVSIRPHMVYVLEEGDETTLSFSRKTVKLQRGGAPIVRALEGGEKVCLADLIALEPKALDIVRQLIAEGFAVQLDTRGRRDLRAVQDLAS
jgi:ribosomal protein L16 Arg81 hydroxylase